MAEETLLGALESRPRGGFRLTVQRARPARPVGRAGNVRCFQRCGQVIVDDGEGPGVGIVDAALLGRERMFQHLVFDTVIGQRPRRIEAERPEVAGQHLHRRDTASLDGFHEFRPGREGE